MNRTCCSNASSAPRASPQGRLYRADVTFAGRPATFGTTGALRSPIELGLNIAQVTNGCVPLGLRLRQAARRLIAGSFGRESAQRAARRAAAFLLGGRHFFQLLRDICEIGPDSSPLCRGFFLGAAMSSNCCARSARSVDGSQL